MVTIARQALALCKCGTSGQGQELCGVDLTNSEAIRSQLKGELDMIGLQEASKDDHCQAGSSPVQMWDIGAGAGAVRRGLDQQRGHQVEEELEKDTRICGVLSTLLLYQILLEDIVLEAEGWWLIIPKTAPFSTSTSSSTGFLIQKWFLPRSSCTFVLQW